MMTIFKGRRMCAALAIGNSLIAPAYGQHASADTQTPDASAQTTIETVTVLGKVNTTGAELGGAELKTLPINSHVVGRAEMERLRFVDPDEFLDRIPGETQVRNLRIPDGGKGYTLPMQDGIPLENPYEGATQRLDRANTFDIERVEVIKGPASALYPSNAFGGVVNVITRDAPLQSESKLSLEGGNFGRFRAGISTGGTWNNLGYFFDINTRNMQGLRDRVVNDRDQVSGKLIYSLSDYTKVTGRIEYIDEHKVSRGDLTAKQLKEDKTQAGKLSSASDLEQQALSLRLEHSFESGYLDINLVRREKDTIGSSRFRGPQDENDLGYSGKAVYRHDFDNFNLVGGYEFYDGTQDVKQYKRKDIQRVGNFIAYENTLTIQAYFLQYQVEPVEDVTFTLGGRYEDIQLDSSLYKKQADFSDFAPKLGLTYQLSKSNMVWLGVSKGFYAPGARKLFSPKTGNPDLAPEKATNIEVGLRGRMGNWHYDTSIYQNDVSNYLVTQEFFDSQGNEYEQTTNAGKVSLKGIESVVEYMPDNSNWRLGVTHTFTRNKYDSFVQSVPGAKDDYSGKILRRSPDHHLNARIAWVPNERFTIELEGDVYSHYYADNQNTPDSKFTRGKRVNLRLDYQLEQWRFWLHGLNLTDTLEDRATYKRGKMYFRTVDGRTFYAGASYQF